MKKGTTIDKIVVIAKLSDGSHRQVLLKKEHEIEVLHAISKQENGNYVRISEEKLEGIEITTKK